jgi:hypothetical protein
MCSMMPAGAGFPGVAETGVDEFIRRWKKDTPTRLWLGLAFGSVVFAAFPLFTIGVPLPAFMLGKKMRERYARKITSHPIYLVRQIIFLVKMAAGMCWGADGGVRAQLGLKPYPPDPGTWRTT